MAAGNVEASIINPATAHCGFFKTDAYVHTAGFMKYPSITFSCWIKAPIAQNEWTGIVLQGEGGSAMGLYIRFSTLKVMLRSSTGSGASDTPVDDWNIGNYPYGWHHLVGVLDGLNRKFYRDGTLIHDANVATANGGSVIQLFSIGRFGSYTGADSYFTGYIDDVRIYERAMGQTEVTKLYQNKNIENSGLVGHWKLNGNATDSGTRRKHGTAVNVKWINECHNVDDFYKTKRKTANDNFMMCDVMNGGKVLSVAVEEA